MKKFILSMVCLLVLIGCSQALGVWGIELNREQIGNYSLKFPIVLNGVYKVPVLEDNYYVRLNPIFTTATDNLTDLGLHQSRYDLMVGTALKEFDGTVRIEAGLAYYAPNNHEGKLETIQSVIALGYYRGF